MKKLPHLPIILILTSLLFWQCDTDDNTDGPATPSINSFTPAEGPIGTSVTISGANFSGSSNENIVRFNGTVATVTAASRNELTATVPPMATTGVITIETEGQTATSSSDFIVTSEAKKPAITSFTPTSGAIGTEVTINGTNFSDNVNGNTVRFNENIATVTAVSTDQLTVKVPPTATTGTITIETGGQIVTSSSEFTVTSEVKALTITDFTPSTGAVGTMVTINGTNFSATTTENIVKVNNIPATVVIASTTQLIILVPQKATTGQITVQVGDQTVSSTLDFTVLQQIWTRKANVWDDLYGLSNAVGFSISNKGYIGTGLKIGSLLNGFWEYDPSNNSWSQKAGLEGESRYDAVGFSIGNKGYIGAGIDKDGNYLTDFWEYNPVYNTWTEKAGLKGVLEWDAIGFSIGDKGYIGTGFNGLYSSDFWEYDPGNNTWTEKTKLESRGWWGAVGFSIGDKGYVVTYDDEDKNALADVWEYDPKTDKWTEKAGFDGGVRNDAVTFSIGGKGYVGTGSDEDSNTLGDFWEYDPKVDKWTKKTDFEGDTRYSAVSFSIGDKGYISTGIGTGIFSHKDLWEYTPE
ncbi:hypothetical protein FNH22_16115 [Fulvivirga sp. M361]|uniref:IPT/TIG domain-containing protein n=1 Tax=Fulvivirga sp. M361 TaxID=2594266 RepID=UPI001179A79F|nr:IPT/TIG domain-containing protein [Fulvivirga sp. M361]TRX56166.1 hypothetical protein FNH22_16115 [Fulvivirga sp. M361]